MDILIIYIHITSCVCICTLPLHSIHIQIINLDPYLTSQNNETPDSQPWGVEAGLKVGGGGGGRV